MKVRVLEVLGYPEGGAAASVIELARALAPERFEVCVASPAGGIGVEERLHKVGIPWFEVPLAGRHDHRSFRLLRQLIRERGIDVVHTHCRNADLHGGWAAKSTGVPWVAHLRGLFVDAEGQRASSIVDLLHRASLRRFPHALLAITDAVRTTAIEVLGIPSHRVVKAPHGVELSRFLCAVPGRRAKVRAALGLAEDDLAVLSIGSLGRCKGQDVLIDALARLSPALRIRAFLVGSGPDRGALEQRAADQHGKVRIDFLGDRDDVPALLDACDVFAHPARWEGFGRVIVEAMAAGRPVVASKVGGIPEIIEDFRSGLLVPPDDSLKLAEALDRLATDRSWAAGLGAAGRRRAQAEFGLPRGTAVIARVLKEAARSSTVGSQE